MTIARDRGTWIEWPATASVPRASNEYDVLIAGDEYDPATQVRRGPGLALDREAGIVTVTYQVEDKPEWRLKADLEASKAEALAAAMSYGNAITAREIDQWAGIEPLSWGLQRDEAAIVRAGGTLGEDAVLPFLAEDKGVSLEAYADDVWANAMRYQAVLRAAVALRRRAHEVLTDEAVDSPAKLAEAVAMLTIEADAAAAALLGG